ncbi:MAG: IS3 family transposase [Polyangiaceae bacterium]
MDCDAERAYLRSGASKKRTVRREPSTEADRRGPEPRQPGAQGRIGKKVVAPPLRREAVRFMCESQGVSRRRACALVGTWRSSYRHASRRRDSERLLSRLRELAVVRPRFGYRRLHVLLWREGERINQKRLYRFYRLAGLSVRRRKRKKPRIKLPPPLPRPIQQNKQWAMDFTHNWVNNVRRLRTLNVVDMFTRECLTIAVDESLPDAGVVRELGTLRVTRNLPSSVIVDNGPEFI